MPHRFTLDPTWLDALPTGLFVLDAAGDIAFANRAFGELSGREPRKLRGMRLDTLIGREDDAELLREILQVYRGFAVTRKVLRLKRDGKIMVVRATLSPVFDKSGETVIGAVGLAEAVNARNKMV